MAQDTRLEKTPEQVVAHLLGASPTTRRQALAWAKEHLAEVVPPLLKALAEKPGATIPYDAIRSLGDLHDPRLSAALVGLVRKPDFPWKPQAIEALADHEFPGAVGVFFSNLGSPAVKSRAASCRGIAALGIKEMDALLSGRLGDEEASVRLEAARALVHFGDDSGVPVVIRDLSLDRHFADADPGSAARDAAARFLKELGASIQTENVPVAKASDLDAILGELKTKLGAPASNFPASIVPHEPDLAPSFRYAVEVRSCPEGDLYLRFDDAGHVVLGRDLFRTFELDTKLIAPIIQALSSMDTGGKGRRILGPISCDFERLAINEGKAWRTLVIGTGRREAAFDGLEDAVVAILRQTRGPERADAQIRRVAPFGIAGGAASRPESLPAGAER